MKILGTIIILAASAINGQAPASHSTLELIEAPEVFVPADACFGRTYTCQAKLSFVVGGDGRVSDIQVQESSRIRPCDIALIHSLRGRIYPEQSTAVRIEERLIGYQCIDGRPANNSFKAMPLRGTP